MSAKTKTKASCVFLWWSKTLVFCQRASKSNLFLHTTRENKKCNFFLFTKTNHKNVTNYTCKLKQKTQPKPNPLVTKNLPNKKMENFTNSTQFNSTWWMMNSKLRFSYFFFLFSFSSHRIWFLLAFLATFEWRKKSFFHVFSSSQLSSCCWHQHKILCSTLLLSLQLEIKRIFSRKKNTSNKSFFLLYQHEVYWIDKNHC